MPVRMAAYKCKYCGRVYETYSGAWKHEKQCFANPKRKACRTCKHCELVGRFGLYDQEIGGYTEYEEYFVCGKTGKTLNRSGEAQRWEHCCRHHSPAGVDNFTAKLTPRRIIEEEVATCQQ